MKPILETESVALRPGAPGLSLTLFRGQSGCVYGRGGSGKSRLIRVLAGEDKPASGSVTVHGRRVLLREGELPRKATPYAMAREKGQPVAKAAEAVSAVGLGEERNRQAAELSPSQQAACSVLPALVTAAPLILIDGALDGLDPWALEGALRLLRGQILAGAALVASTNRTDIAAFFDTLIVLRDQFFIFSGSLDDLAKTFDTSDLKVETKNPLSAIAMAEPFEVMARQTSSGVEMTAREGQDLAAKLLIEGYGDVSAVWLREPTVQEALIALQ